MAEKQHGRQLMERYNASHIVPWSCYRSRIYPQNSTASIAYLQEARYMLRQWLLAIVDVGKLAEMHIKMFEAMGRTSACGRYVCFGYIITYTRSALALATEPPNDEMMKRPLVGRGENFIKRYMWRNIIGQSMYQLVVLEILMFDGKRLLKISGPNSDAVIDTLIFNTFVFYQVFNQINNREMEKINVFRGIFGSRIFTGVLISTVVFQVIYSVVCIFSI